MWYKWLHTLVTRHQWRSQRTANNSGTTFLGFQTQEFGAAGLLRQFIDHLYHMEDPGVDGRTILRSITSIYQPNNAHIISHKTILKHFKNTLKHSDMFRSCQFIIRELCSLLKLYYSIHNSIRKYELNCEYCNISLARNKSPWWWSDKIEACRSVFKCFKSVLEVFMWNYMCIRWLINWSDSTIMHGATIRFTFSSSLCTFLVLGTNLTEVL